MSFLKYQSAEELDINIDGNRVAIMFLDTFAKSEDLKI